MSAENDLRLIEAGLNTLGQTGSIVAQGKTNRKTREWNEKMYKQQRADALADWHMQNEYNSPTSQMARLREAGLNPNLVYGKGADNTASAVRSSSSGNWSPKAPDFSNISSGLLSYVDLQVKQAQIDNLKVQNTVAVQEAALKAATTAKVNQDAATSAFELDQAKSLASVSLEYARENLRKLKTGIDIDLQENERKAAMNSSNLREAAERILKIRAERANTEAERGKINAQIDNLEKDNRLKQLDIDLKKNGVQPSDNLFFRILGRLLSGVSLDDLKDAGEQAYKNNFGKPD